MKSILIFGVFWSIYGLLGLLGIQVIPSKYRGTDYEKKYKRFSGISNIILGLPWLIVYFITRNMEISVVLMVLILIVCSVPSIVFSVSGERKFRDTLEQ